MAAPMIKSRDRGAIIKGMSRFCHQATAGGFKVLTIVGVVGEI